MVSFFPLVFDTLMQPCHELSIDTALGLSRALDGLLQFFRVRYFLAARSGDYIIEAWVDADHSIGDARDTVAFRINL